MYVPTGINRALSCGSVASMASAGGDYEPRAILVTGGAGFIASHVVRRLVRDYGFKVREIWPKIFRAKGGHAMHGLMPPKQCHRF